MLPSNRRVQKELFKKTLAKSRVLHFPYFSIRFGRNEAIVSRISFVTSGKIGKAVERNRLRRRGYDAISKVKIKPNLTLLFFFKKEAVRLPFVGLKSEVESALRQGGFLV